MPDSRDTQARFGVVATLEHRTDGGIQLRLDDVAAQPTLDAVSWRNVSFYTATKLDAAELNSMSLSESQLAEIGLAVIARLTANKGRDA